MKHLIIALAIAFIVDARRFGDLWVCTFVYEGTEIVKIMPAYELCPTYLEL